MANPLQDLLPILVKLELCDFDFAGCDADGYALAVALLACDSLDVYDVFEAVYGDDLAFAALVATALDHDFVVLADGD